jgi:hypothetical protein
LTAYWYSDNSNYTNSNVTRYFEVTPYVVWTNVSIPSGSKYSPTNTYEFEIKVKGNIVEKFFEINLTDNPTDFTNIMNKGDGIFHINFTGLPAGNYLYRWYIKDNESNWIIVNQTYSVFKSPVNLSWKSPTSWSFSTGTTVTVKCSSNPTINLTLYVNEITKGFYSTVLGEVSTTLSSSTPTVYHISCYPTDTNYSSETLEGTLYFTQVEGQNQQPSLPSGSFSIVGPFSLSIDAGKNATVSFMLNNTYEFSIRNISISLDGLPSDWYNLSKSFIDILRGKSSETIIVSFNIPESAEAKSYSLNFKALSKTKNATRMFSLIVNPLTEIMEENETEVSEVVNETVEEINMTAKTPTGLIIKEYNPGVAIVGLILSLSIFIFREKITKTLLLYRKRKRVIIELSRLKKRLLKKNLNKNRHR